MAPIKHRKRELFAQELAKGKSQVEAYTCAGYKAHDSNAAALANHPEVSARVAEIIGKAAEKVGIDKVWVLGQLVDHAMVCKGDKKVRVKILPKNSETPVEMDLTARDPAAANKALELIGKELGMFKERLELSGSVALGDRLDKALGRSK